MVEYFPAIRQPLHPCDVTACFVDIRGFTSFTNSSGASHAHMALRVVNCLFGALNAAIDFSMSNLMNGLAPGQGAPRDGYVPTTQALGDGAMLLWEHPGTNEGREKDLISRFVLDFAAFLQQRFADSIRDLHQETSTVPKLGLGIGLSRGLAWKIHDSSNGNTEYVGGPLNQAARLQSYARPHGLLADLRLDPNLFMERYCLGEGTIDQLRVEGISEDIKIWSSDQQLRWRRVRQPTLASAMASLEPLPAHNIESIALSEFDANTIFDEREDWETKFTADLASRVCRNEVAAADLERLVAILNEMDDMLLYEDLNDNELRRNWNKQGVEFHSQISKMSVADGAEAKRRESYTRAVYRRTRRVYQEATDHFSYEEIAAEHREILKFVRLGDVELVTILMREHLSRHYERARDSLLAVKPREPD